MEIILLNIFLLVAGLILLFYGSNLLVSSSVDLAYVLKIPTLLIGLTIVAAGTSSPEIFVNVYSVWQGLDDIALGNVLGSNIVNFGFILGFVLIFSRSAFSFSDLKFDIFFLILASFSLLFLPSFPNIGLSLKGILTRENGLIFLILLVCYYWFSYKKNSKEKEVKKEIKEKRDTSFLKIFFGILLGIVFLYFGSDFLVQSSQYVARDILGISERIIGLTVIAIGTGLPEIITSLVSLWKKEAELSIGMLIGSNTFNILGVLGITSLVSPLSISESFTFDFWVMMFLTFLVTSIILLPRNKSRMIGFLLLFSYIIYIIALSLM